MKFFLWLNRLIVVLLVTVTLCPAIIAEASNRPSYVRYSSCSSVAKSVLDSLNVAQDRIHECKSEPRKIDGETWHLVSLQYGLAQDCSAGCFYDRVYVAVLPSNTKGVAPKIELIPPLKHLSISQGYCEWRLDDQPPPPKGFADIIVERRTSLGWKITYHKAKVCTRTVLKPGPGVQTWVPKDEYEIHGEKIQTTTTGSFFYTYEGNPSLDDFFRLKKEGHQLRITEDASEKKATDKILKKVTCYSNGSDNCQQDARRCKRCVESPP